jgi:cation diffusion facilitator family transporter
VAEHSTSHILQSLAANAVIATAKGIAAVFTGAGAMLAETLHSFADCGNQILLLVGVKRAQRPASAAHPLGYGRALYFWSFMVALLLFVGGGCYSIYEGIHKLREPEPVERVWLGLAILGFSLLIEGGSTLSNLREMGRRRGKKSLITYLRATKDSDLVVVFGENAAASLGLVLAMVALLLAHATGDGRWDAIGSLAIGAVLIGVAVFLAVEVKSLLIGESADPEIEIAAREIAGESPHFKALLSILTVQQGPGEVVVAMKVRLSSELTSDEVCEAINVFERRLKARCPEVRWSFIEPDLPKKPASELIAAAS